MKKLIKLENIILTDKTFVESVIISTNKKTLSSLISNLLIDGEHKNSLTIENITNTTETNTIFKKVYFYDPVCSKITIENVLKWFYSIEDYLNKQI